MKSKNFEKRKNEKKGNPKNFRNVKMNKNEIQFSSK